MKSISEIIDFIKRIRGLSKDNEVAKLLGMKGPALSNHKIKGTIPYQNLISFCHNNHVSVDYFLTGSPSSEGTKALEGIPRTSPENPPQEALSNMIRFQEELLKSKDETIHLQRELLAAHKSMNEKENTVSNLEARLQKLEESSKELEKLREENTSLKKEIAAQEVSEEGKSQLAS